MSVISASNLGVRFSVRKAGRSGVWDRLCLWRPGRLEPFWALRQVSFELAEKEVLGLVGGNGAGKSTLCRTLARLLPADEGQLQVRGRVALLSLNAGLRRELTGRDNLYLGGALLGLSRRRITLLLPEIIAFAELEDFIDNPVRTYSSGMRTRLGFALATAIDPDVLILDEVLGVGDRYFKKLAEERVQRLMSRSRAIVLVSHGSNMIRQLCSRALWLDRGRVVRDGPTADVVDAYERWQESRLGQRRSA